MAKSKAHFPADPPPPPPPGFIRLEWWRGGGKDSGPEILAAVWSDPFVQVDQVAYVSEGLVDEDGNGRDPKYWSKPNKLSRVTNVAMANGKCILTGEPLASVLTRIEEAKVRLESP